MSIFFSSKVFFKWNLKFTIGPSLHASKIKYYKLVQENISLEIF